MIKIRAFKALRPKEKWVKEIAALPYDVMTDEEAKKMVAGHPYSFLNIDKPEIHMSSAENASYIYARNLLNQMAEEGMFVQETNCMYLYELESQYGKQYGLGCLVSAEDYKNCRIKQHEKTRLDKEEDRMKHIAYCRAHTGPVYLIEDEIEGLGEYLRNYADRHKPLYDFKDEEKVTQRLYAIKEQAIIEELTDFFASADSLYIADGHHRAAAAVKIAERMGDRLPEARDFLAVIFPKEELHILPYHRIVEDESGYNKIDLLNRLSLDFEIMLQGSREDFIPSKLHEIGMYYDRQWYSLKVRAGSLRHQSEVENLDVTILQEKVLGPVFKITEPRTDARIDFVPGLEGVTLAKECLTRHMDVIFTLYPTSIDSLIAVADAGLVMPPKSTWFEPKLRSGLLIHRF